MLFAMRFDFRNPELAGTTMAERYDAALEIAEWADRLGCVSIAISEHHGSADGYLPSPLPIVAAMAARTTTVQFSVAALIAPFYDPIRLAEDMLVLDNLSKGRVDLIVAGGYVTEEFDMYGVPKKERVARLKEVVSTLRGAFSGEPFEYRGRTVHLTPAPVPDGRSTSRWAAAARRQPAGRRGSATGSFPRCPRCGTTTETRCRRWVDPIPDRRSSVRTVWSPWPLMPRQGWAEMAPFFLHECNAYGVWQAQEQVASPYRVMERRGAVASQRRVRGPHARRADPRAEGAVRSPSPCCTRSAAACRPNWPGRACGSSRPRCCRRSPEPQPRGTLQGQREVSREIGVALRVCAPVDELERPRNRRRLVRREERHQAGHVLGGGLGVEWCVLVEVLDDRGQQPHAVGQRRTDEPRGDGVHPDAARSEFEGSHLHQHGQAGLGGAVGAHAVGGLYRIQARGGHDRTALPPSAGPRASGSGADRPG